MERYGEYMSDGNMMPAFQLVKSKSRRRCRKAFNVVPAQALMELFLSEEGLIHKRLHGNVIHLIHLIQNEIYLSLKGICDMNEIGHKSHRSHRGQNRVSHSISHCCLPCNVLYCLCLNVRLFAPRLLTQFQAMKEILLAGDTNRSLPSKFLKLLEKADVFDVFVWWTDNYWERCDSTLSYKRS